MSKKKGGKPTFKKIFNRHYIHVLSLSAFVWSLLKIDNSNLRHWKKFKILNFVAFYITRIMHNDSPLCNSRVEYLNTLAKFWCQAWELRQKLHQHVPDDLPSWTLSRGAKNAPRTVRYRLQSQDRGSYPEDALGGSTASPSWSDILVLVFTLLGGIGEQKWHTDGHHGHCECKDQVLWSAFLPKFHFGIIFIFDFVNSPLNPSKCI